MAKENDKNQTGSVSGDSVKHTVSTVGKVKNKSVPDKDLENSSPSGKSNIDPNKK